MQLFNNYVMLLVLASKGYSVISPVVNEEKMRSGQWLGLMLYGFLQCFDTDSWVTGRTSGPQKPRSSNTHRFSSRTDGGGPDGKPLNGSSRPSVMLFLLYGYDTVRQ